MCFFSNMYKDSIFLKKKVLIWGKSHCKICLTKGHVRQTFIDLSEHIGKNVKYAIHLGQSNVCQVLGNMANEMMVHCFCLLITVSKLIYATTCIFAGSYMSFVLIYLFYYRLLLVILNQFIFIQIFLVKLDYQFIVCST